MLKTSLAGVILLSQATVFANPCDEGALNEDQVAVCLEGDSLFDRRGELYFQKDKTFEERAQLANEAIAKFSSILAQTSGKDRAYVGSKIARSYIYIGDNLIPKSEKSERRELFKKCQAFVETEMAPELVGDENLQPYYYTLASCWAFKLEMSNPIVQIREKKAIEKLIYDGVQYAGGNEYLGSGIRRSLSGIRSSRAAIAIGAGNVEEAAAEAQAAIETPENDLFNNYVVAGADFCENYRRKANAFIADPNSDIFSMDTATETIEEAFSHFEVEGEFDNYAVGFTPQGFEIDTLVCIERLIQFAVDNGLDPVL